MNTNGLSELLASEKKRRVVDIVSAIIFTIVTVVAVAFGARIASVVAATLVGLSLGQAIMRSRIILYMNIVFVQEAVVEYLLVANGVDPVAEKNDAFDRIERTSSLLSDGLFGNIQEQKKGRKN